MPKTGERSLNVNAANAATLRVDFFDTNSPAARIPTDNVGVQNAVVFTGFATHSLPRPPFD
jgi:hypothetical protein